MTVLTPWAPGADIVGPVYLDSNVLIGGLVRSHWLYADCAQVLGELLSERTPIVVSDVVINEALWALSKIAYCDLMNQKFPSAFWAKKTYRKHYAKIFAERAATVTAVSDWLRALDLAGHPMDVVRSSKAEWRTITDNTAAYMKDFGLTPADAANLALAGAHAHTFITADNDYRAVGGAGGPPGLAVLLVAPAP